VLTTPGAYFPRIATANAGVIVERTTEDLVSSIVRMVSDPAETRRMGERGRELVEREFAWSSIIDRFEALYLELADRARLHRSGGSGWAARATPA
jgi:glycosyltransferase involved in cell wall biosynthesis